MSQSDPRCVVRIAIALAVLKHKPRDQSTASYLLDLQSQFPFATKRSESPDWRTYALELEKQLATLKAQRDADQELLLKIPTDVSQVSSTSDAPPPKKKSKKNPTKDQHDLVWSWDQSRANWSRVLSSQYPSSPSLIAAYGSLKSALAAPNADLSHASRLTDAILRALDTMHLFLFSPSDPSLSTPAQSALGAPMRLKPEHIDTTRIALASPLLMYLLRTALHTLVRTVQDSTKSKRPRQRLHTTTPAFSYAYAHVDEVLDRLLQCILLPLLRAITPLCYARLAPLVSTSLKGDMGKASRAVGKGKDKGKDKDKRIDSVSIDPPKKTDVRTDVFALIGTSLEALDALPPLVRPSGPCARADGGRGGDGSIAGGIRDCLGLETIRELETLYATPSSPSPPAPAPAPARLPSSLQPSPQQSQATPSEPPPPPTPLSAQSQPRSQPQSRAQRGAAAESRAKLLERLAGTRVERVRALATRDAGWFLVSTLNLCVTPPRPPAHGHDVPRDPAAGKSDALGRLLREALLDRIGRLVRSVHVPFGGSISDTPGQHPSDPSDALDGRADLHDCNATNSKFAIDPVCRNVLLAICERAMSHLASS